MQKNQISIFFVKLNQKKCIRIKTKSKQALFFLELTNECIIQ